MTTRSPPELLHCGNRKRPLLSAVALGGLHIFWGIAFYHLSVAADVGSTDVACRTAVAKFFKEPTDSNLKSMSSPDGDTCWASLGLDDYQTLNKLIERGNAPAALFAAPHVRQLDGAELQDTLRALGQFASYHMREFLASTSSALTDLEFTDALTLLPRDLDDDFGAQLIELRARRIALEQVDDPGLQDRKRSAIAAIDKSISDIEGPGSGATRNP
jgi:hypothetical protein